MKNLLQWLFPATFTVKGVRSDFGVKINMLKGIKTRENAVINDNNIRISALRFKNSRAGDEIAAADKAITTLEQFVS